MRSQIVGSPGFQSWFDDRNLSLSEEFRAVLEEGLKQSSDYRLRGMRVEAQNASEWIPNVCFWPEADGLKRGLSTFNAVGLNRSPRVLKIRRMCHEY